MGYSFDEIVMQFENMLSFPLDRNNHYRIFEELDQLLHSEHSMAFYNKLIYVCERIIGFLKDYFNHFIPVSSKMLISFLKRFTEKAEKRTHSSALHRSGKKVCNEVAVSRNRRLPGRTFSQYYF